MLTAETALQALRELGLDYRPDIRQPDGVWQAVCPRCWSLVGDTGLLLNLHEQRDGRVTGGCRRCGKVALVYLAQALKPVAAEQRIRALELREAAQRLHGADLELRVAALEHQLAERTTS